MRRRASYECVSASLAAASYAQMQREGARFPPVDDAMAPVFTPPPTGLQPSGGGGGAPAASGGLAGGGSTEDELAKLRKDLDAVSEKVGLCREMLPHSPGIASDDALAEATKKLETEKLEQDEWVHSPWRC